MSKNFLKPIPHLLCGVGVGLLLACQPKTEAPVIVSSHPHQEGLKLSEVVFKHVRLEGTPHQMVDHLNQAMKEAGFRVELQLAGTPRKDQTIVQMRQVTLREVIDQICLQLNLSYWDDAKHQKLHLQGGLSSSFDVYTRDEMGFFTPAGPRSASPPGYDLLPLRSEYFNQSIKSLEGDSTP